MSVTQTPMLASVKAFLARQHHLYIDGRWIESSNDARLSVFDPATGGVIASCASAHEQDIDWAVSSAWRAFQTRVWSRMLPAQRERILLRFADLVESHADELAQLITLEQGKSLNLARHLEVESTLNWMRYTAGLTTKLNGQSLDLSIPIPSNARYQAWTVKEPVGVVVGIAPSNFPLMIGMWKVIPALAAGCSVVLKPADSTPLSMLRVAELATQAGVPDGVFNLVTGLGDECGRALVKHPLVNKVSFTGSTSTGKKIAVSAAQQLKRVSLELGGKNPAVVLKSADPAQVIEGLMLGSFLNQGQVCAASSRIYIEAPLFDKLVGDFELAIKSLSIGPGFDPSAQINPLSTLAHQQRVSKLIEQASQAGAELLMGQSTPNSGYYIPPVLVVEPTADLALNREEVFGPVVNLVRVADAQDALQQANDSDYGLVASVWTQNIAEAMQFSRALQAGTVWVNSHALIDANMPFGGMKQSGLGRDFGDNWLDAWCEVKSVCVRY